LVGGGAAADLVRRWDRAHKLGGERSHDLALAAMAFNARLVNALVRDSVLVAKRSAIRRACAAGAVSVLDPPAVLEEAERKSARRLPRAWNVTSDSIAAFLAINWRAAALVLIKSTPRPSGQSVKDAARDGLVDKHFPVLADRIPLVAWANLRSKRIAIERWL
jgi:5-(aminomethyl)-3-furanmethanol phosphate kinase